jgi:hypothetical protein
LPEALIWDLVRRTGHAIHHQAKGTWLFHGRAVKIVDGSTVTMPDTPANQAAYPQLDSQAPGVGFPIARLLVVFSLAVGTVLQAALGPYQGKQTGELALLRQVLDHFQPGDIALADRFFGSYWTIAALRARGVAVVMRLHQARSADFRRGRRLGREDHLATWTKPSHVPDWMSRAEYEAMPAQLTVRELRVRVRDRTKRVRDLVLVTTLVDAASDPADELGGLYRQRWHAELDLRALKTEMRMEMLRTKSPAMVRKRGGGSPAWVQPDPGDHGRGGAGRGGKPADAELQGGGTYGAVVRGGPSVRCDADRGGPAAADGVDRSEACGRSPGPLRAPCGEAPAEALSAADDAAEDSQTFDQARHSALREDIGTGMMELSA